MYTVGIVNKVEKTIKGNLRQFTCVEVSGTATEAQNYRRTIIYYSARDHIRRLNLLNQANTVAKW